MDYGSPCANKDGYAATAQVYVLVEHFSGYGYNNDRQAEGRIGDRTVKCEARNDANLLFQNALESAHAALFSLFYSTIVVHHMQ